MMPRLGLDTCPRCGHLVQPDPPSTPARYSGWVVGHIKSRSTHPELTWDPSNWQLEHRACSDASGTMAVIEKAKLEALRAAGITDSDALARIVAGQTPLFSGAPGPGKASPLPSLSPGDLPSTRPAPGGPIVALLDALPPPAWSRRSPAFAEWLAPIETMPADAAPPLAISAQHADAVGSYGAEFEEWVRAELGYKLRWWQRLAAYRILEHDKTGRLVWRQVILSAPRRAGKSVLLVALALWRIAHADKVGETQTVMFVSKDLPTGREIFLKAKPYAERRKLDGWKMRESNGTEEVAAPGVIGTDVEDLIHDVGDVGDVDHVDGERVISRWLLRSPESCYGYDVSVGMVDESWGVKPTAISEGLEPAQLERLWRQLLLVSTAHPRASSLMRRRLLAGLRELEAPKRRLVLLWSARPSDDPADPQVWRAASPHWSDDRAELIEDKYSEALAGEVDPEFDDLAPMESFTSQYLNVWRLRESAAPGDTVVEDDVWHGLTVPVPRPPADAIALESWFGDTVAIAQAWRTDDFTTTVHVHVVPDLEAAITWCAAAGVRRVTAGYSLASDERWKEARVTVAAEKMTALEGVRGLQRMLTENGLRHTGGDELNDQVLELRTKQTPNGVRLTAANRADAIKAVVWAAAAARSSPERRGARRIRTARAS